MYDIKTLVDEAIIFDDLCDFAQTYLTIERHRKGMKYAEEWEEEAVHNAYKNMLRTIAHLEEELYPPLQLELDL
jgi:hypothetical protein|tara:strand:- start:313 stop:534 length:222 start_codon:yes stop_codon:yes gene_type:complete